MMEVLTQDVSASKIGVESSGLKTIPFPENFNSFHTTPPILQERDILWKHVVVSSHTIYFGAQASIGALVASQMLSSLVTKDGRKVCGLSFMRDSQLARVMTEGEMHIVCLAHSSHSLDACEMVSRDGFMHAILVCATIEREWVG